MVLLAILPIAVFLIFGQPVALLQTARAIEAAHIPIVTKLSLPELSDATKESAPVVVRV